LLGICGTRASPSTVVPPICHSVWCTRVSDRGMKSRQREQTQQCALTAADVITATRLRSVPGIFAPPVEPKNRRERPESPRFVPAPPHNTIMEFLRAVGGAHAVNCTTMNLRWPARRCESTREDSANEYCGPRRCSRLRNFLCGSKSGAKAEFRKNVVRVALGGEASAAASRTPPVHLCRSVSIADQAAVRAAPPFVYRRHHARPGIQKHRGGATLNDESVALAPSPVPSKFTRGRTCKDPARPGCHGAKHTGAFPGPRARRLHHPSSLW